MKGVQKSKFKGTKGIFKPNKTSFKKGLPPWNKGKKCPPRKEETRIKISNYMKGKKHRLGTHQQLEARLKHSERMRGENGPGWKGGI